MSDFQVTKTRILAGIWEGVVDFIGTGEIREPGLVCLHDGRASTVSLMFLIPRPMAAGFYALQFHRMSLLTAFRCFWSTIRILAKP